MYVAEPKVSGMAQYLAAQKTSYLDSDSDDEPGAHAVVIFICCVFLNLCTCVAPETT